MHYFIRNDAVFIEAHEYFIKQTYRNRCTLSSANGMLALSVPLQDEGSKTCITEKRISYAENWQAKHWRAIESSYNNSPYFEYFEQEIKLLVFSSFEYLFELNIESLRTVLHILRIQKKIESTASHEISFEGIDLRTEISPKKKSGLHFPEYYQVFKPKTGFIKNLSILDLLFHEGLQSAEYLKKIG